jgi:hypothetical protein
MTQHSRDRMSLPPPRISDPRNGTRTIGWGASDSMPVAKRYHAPEPRPSLSPLELVASVTLVGIALAMAIMLIITMPPMVGVPIAVALIIGPLWQGMAHLARRWRRWTRRIARREQPTGAEPGAAGPREPGSAARIETITGIGALAGLSVALLAVAVVMPREAGTVFGGIGLAGLLVVRLLAMNAGWAPRGAAWSRHQRAMPPATPRLSSPLERTRATDAWSPAAESRSGGADRRAGISSPNRTR